VSFFLESFEPPIGLDVNEDCYQVPAEQILEHHVCMSDRLTPIFTPRPSAEGRQGHSLSEYGNRWPLDCAATLARRAALPAALVRDGAAPSWVAIVSG
jgi:hypothetical protein